MASETAVIILAQADAEHGEVVVEPEGGHAETLGEENLAHAEVGMPQLDFALYPNLIFWLVVALLALYFILSRVALPRIGTVLAERNDAIANDIEMAAALKRRAEEAEAAYNAALAKARDEAHKIAAETRAGIDGELASLMAKADAEIGAKAGDSEKRIAEIRDSAARSVEEVARDTATALVEAMLPGAADPAAIETALANRLKG
jgi:F-type H+-transporting ATPase subunit b